MKRPELKHERERPHIEIPEGFILLQDTREQKPLFKPCDHIIARGLKTGDYSILGFEEALTVERKSIPDLFGSLGKGRDNFEKRIVRMKAMTWAAILIEGSEKRTMRKQAYSKMNVNQIYHALSSYEVGGIHIYFAENKRDAQDWVLSRLTRFYNHVRRGKVEAG